jgi:hypothetical protein
MARATSRADLPTDEPVALAAAINRLPVPRPWAFDASTEDRILVPALDVVSAAPPAFRDSVAAALDTQGAAVLAGSTPRLALLALRYNRPVYLERALLALALAAQATPVPGELVTDLAIPAAAARLMGHDPASIFKAAIAAAPTAGADLLRRSAHWEPPIPTGDPRALAGAINRRPVTPAATPIPAADDLTLLATLVAVGSASRPFREAVSASLDAHGAAVLNRLACRLPTLSLQMRRPDYLARALFALTLAAQATSDPRDLLLTIPMPGLAARLHGQEPGPFYAAAIVGAPAAGAELLRRSAPWEPYIPTRDPSALAEAVNCLPASRPESSAPSSVDLALVAALDALLAAARPFREAVATALDVRGAAILVGTAARLTSLAAWIGEPLHLDRALLALAMAAQGTADSRDVLVTVPMPALAARLLGRDPEPIYEQAIAVAPAAGAELLRRSAP